MTEIRPARARFFDRPYLLLSLTSLFWAGNIVLGRYVAGDIPPLLLGFLRWAGAAIIALPFAWAGLRREWPIIRTNLSLIGALSATGIGAYNSLAYWGLNYTEALNALLIQSTGPLLIALWGFLIWRDRLTGRQLLGILTSLIGVVVIICRGDLLHLQQLTLNPGDLMIFGALIVYGVYAALLRAKPALSALSLLVSTVIGGAVVLIPFVIAEYISGARMHVTPTTLAALAYVSVFPSLLAFMFFVRGVELIGANRASPFFHLMPVFGSIIAILFLGETFRLFHAIGFALVLAGVFVATTSRMPPPPEPTH